MSEENPEIVHLGDDDFGVADFDDDIIDVYARSSLYEYRRAGIFRFLDLSGELRNRVYGYCLRNCRISEVEANPKSNSRWLYINFPLLGVCQQIQAEFLHLLIRRKFVSFTLEHSSWPSPHLQRWMPWKKNFSTDHIKSILSSPVVSEEDKSFMKSHGVTVQAATLTELRCIGSFTQDLVASLIRGVPEVRRWCIRMKIENRDYEYYYEETHGRSLALMAPEDRKRIFDDLEILETLLKYWTLWENETWTIDYMWKQGTRGHNEILLFYIILNSR